MLRISIKMRAYLARVLRIDPRVVTVHSGELIRLAAAEGKL